jgi:hypothetical protein
MVTKWKGVTMIKYYTVQFVKPSYVVYAYRGTESDNTLERVVPPDQRATKSIQIEPGMSQEDLDQLLYRDAVPLLQSDPNKRLLVRVEDDEVTIWIE